MPPPPIAQSCASTSHSHYLACGARVDVVRRKPFAQHYLPTYSTHTTYIVCVYKQEV